MSILPNADAARAAAQTGPDLPAFLARRESGAAPSIKPMSFGPAPSAPRVEPTMLPPSAHAVQSEAGVILQAPGATPFVLSPIGKPTPAPAPAAPLPGMSIAEKVYSELVTLMHPRSPFVGAADNLAGIVEPKRGSGNVVMLHQGGVFALSFTRPLPEMGQDFTDRYTLRLDHEAQTVTVLSRKLDIGEEYVGGSTETQADSLSALLGELAAALDRGAAGKMRLAPIAIPRTDAAIPAAFARTFEALDSGAAAMPPSLDTMSAPQQRADLAPFEGSHVMLAAGGGEALQPPAVALSADAGRMEPRPGAKSGGVVVSLRPSSSSTGRAFPRPIDTVPAAAMLPPVEPVQVVELPEPSEADCLALIEAAQGAALTERGIRAPLEAFEVEQDAKTGALTCRPDESHPCWKPAPPRAVAPRRAAPAPAATSVPPAPAAAPAPAPRARKARTQATPAPVPAAAPAAPKASRQKAAPKNKPQAFDLQSIIRDAVQSAVSENVAAVKGAINAEFAKALQGMFGN